MNSPFSLTTEFVERAFLDCPDAIVCSLQQQSWRGGRPRADWIAVHQPRIYTFGSHRQRPRFLPGGSASAEYEWCVWLPSERDRDEIPGGRVLQPGPGEPPVQGDLLTAGAA